MKRILISVLLLTTVAKAETIPFIDNDWRKARAEATSTGKYIFVDAYTDWCYWCKVMDKETFPDTQVVAFMNANFVPLKLEMEHNYGIRVAMKYHVSGFPSFLILTPDGKLVRKLTGYIEAKAFIEELKETIDTKQYPPLEGMSATIETEFPEFYKKSFTGYTDKRVSPEATEVNEFITKQKNLFSEINYGVIVRFAQLLNETNRNFLLDNRIKFEALYGKSEIDNAIDDITGKLLNTAVQNKSETGLQATITFLEKYSPDTSGFSKVFYSLSYYKGIGDWKNMAKQVDSFIAIKGYEGSYINDWAWTVYEKCNDTAVVIKALSWMQPVIQKKQEFASLDTYAALLYKTGQYALARTYALTAIDLGKAAGDKTEETEKLLKKIEAAK